MTTFLGNQLKDKLPSFVKGQSGYGCTDGIGGQQGGAILIIDYGRDGNPGDSLQAVADHAPVDIFHEPGTADLSHWVDFAALRRIASDTGARLIGPVPQGRFLCG